MSRNKRLFLLAGYDKDCIIDGALIYYAKQLSKHGDVILCMDCDCHKSETDKTKKYTIHTIAKRHGEYDFGSYKRAYKYAYDKDLLKNYDYIYLVNDSVYGPVGGGSIEQALLKMESSKCGFVGMLSNEGKGIPKHIQSWFVGIKRHLALNKKFKDFILSVSKQSTKWDIITAYEFGLSELMKTLTKGKMYTIVEQNQDVCNIVWVKAWVLIEKGIPFLKKIAIPKMFSLSFLEKTLNNKILFDEIKSQNPKIQSRPITYFFWVWLKKAPK